MFFGVLLLFFHGSHSKSFRAARMLNLRSKHKTIGGGGVGRRQWILLLSEPQKNRHTKNKKKNARYAG